MRNRNLVDMQKVNDYLLLLIEIRGEAKENTNQLMLRSLRRDVYECAQNFEA